MIQVNSIFSWFRFESFTKRYLSIRFLASREAVLMIVALFSFHALQIKRLYFLTRHLVLTIYQQDQCYIHIETSQSKMINVLQIRFGKLNANVIVWPNLVNILENQLIRKSFE